MHIFGMTITFLISWLMVLIGSVTPQNNIIYVVTTARWPNPQAKVQLRTDSHSEAHKMYDELSDEITSQKDGSVVLYNVAKGEVEHITRFSEPLYAVNCVETARQQKGTDRPFKDETKENSKMAIASTIISKVLGYLSNVAVVGPTIKMHIMAPYYAATSQGAKVAGSVVSWYCSITGALIGAANNRHYLGALGGGALGYVAGSAVEMFIMYMLKCLDCNGSGFVGDFKRCPRCDGFGYHGHKEY